MESGKVKIWHSIVTRFGLFFIGLLLLAIAVSGFLVYKRASTIIGTFSQERIAHSSTLAEQSFYSLLTEVENDISVISENQKIQAFTNSSSPEIKQEIEHLFYVNLKNKPNYFQIRLISIKDGKEIIRLDKKGKQIITTPNNKLQNKSDRPYYQAALKLRPNEYYFSSISLNEEYGVVSPSLTPTIRAISLIHDTNKQPTHILAINVDLKGFYKNLRSLMTSGIQLLLIDQDGQYLFAYDMAKCFSKQLRSYERFDADFVNPFSKLLTDSIRFETLKAKNGDRLLSQIKSIKYSNNDHQIFLLSYLKENIALSSVLYIKQYSYLIIPVVSLATLFIAVIFIRILAIRIGSITEAIGDYEQSSQPTIKLSERRKDELGVLARTFIKMKDKINQQMAELKSSLEKEQKAIKEKDEFLQNMSHELRTPLNAISGLTQLLKKNKPKPEQEPIIEAIHRSAQSLTGLMYDILDHQKLVEGRVQLKYEPSEISQILTDIYASYRYDAVNKGISFELKIDPMLQGNLYESDALRLTQIITNLIVNAIKFTDSGKITVDAVAEKDQFLVVRISDTGKGILPENLKKIRERFYREADHNTTEGFGLGLSIVKQLVDLFAGELLINSTHGVGSTFAVKLPLLPVNDTKPNSQKEITSLSLGDLEKPCCILHIEDDEPARLLMNQLIQSPSIELIQANNWCLAQQFIDKRTPDLIISDLKLDNKEVSKELITLKNKLNTSIIVISAFENDHMELVSNYYLQKPFDLDQLIDLVIVLLGSSQFDQPQLSESYNQYDNDPIKIKKFLDLLISEFETYILRIGLAFESKDETEWKAIRHKLITHIRSLELNRLQQTLPEDLMDLDEGKLIAAKKLLLYNLSFFRNEWRLFK